MTYNDCALILSAAFLGSLSHCAGMCGGIVLALNMKAISHSRIIAACNNTLYFFGRMCSYIFIGLMFAFVSQSFSFSDTARGIIFITLGILLILSVFGSIFFPKILTKILPSGDYNWYKKLFTFFNVTFFKFDSIRFYFIGILNGFLPCHLVYIFALKAANTLNFKDAFLTMFIFSIGTFLPLFLIGFFSYSLLNTKIRKTLLWACSFIILYFALSSISNGISILNGTQDNHINHSSHHH